MRSIALTLGMATAMWVAACGTAADVSPSDGRSEIAIAVGARGYTPSEVEAPAGAPVRLVFTRTSDDGCGQQLVFPDLELRRDLPLGEPVSVDITMPAAGRVAFTCGMDMYRGAVVAR